MTRGDALRSRLTVEDCLGDIQAAIDAAGEHGKAGVVGFCWGGSLAFLAATRLTGFDAAVGYYGGWIARYADEKPGVPVLLHFGERDFTIPIEDVEKVMRLRPDVSVHIYPAGHAFDCDARKDFDPPSFDPGSAALAMERTLAFLAPNLT